MNKVKDNLLANVKRLYELHNAGGSLHIVLDDANITKENIKFCIDYSNKEFESESITKEQHELEIYIATQMLLMSYKQKQRLIAECWWDLA